MTSRRKPKLTLDERLRRPYTKADRQQAIRDAHIYGVMTGYIRPVAPPDETKAER